MRIYLLVRTKKCYKKVNTENLLMMKMKGKSNTELDKTMHISLILYVSLLHVRNAGQISVAEVLACRRNGPVVEHLDTFKYFPFPFCSSICTLYSSIYHVKYIFFIVLFMSGLA